jgi:hypothetical protein
MKLQYHIHMCNSLHDSSLNPKSLYLTIYVLSESSWAVIVVTALVKDDERGSQSHTSTSLLYQSATTHHAVNTNDFSTSCFDLSAMDSKIEQRVCIKFCVKFGKSTTKTVFHLYMYKFARILSTTDSKYSIL